MKIAIFGGSFDPVHMEHAHYAQAAKETGKPGSLEEFCKIPRTRKEIAAFLDMTQAYALRRYVEPLIEQGVLAYTIPEKPHARDQKIMTVPKE